MSERKVARVENDLHRLRWGIDSIEIFDKFRVLLTVHSDVNFVFYTWSKFYVSSRVKTIFEGERLRQFVEDGRQIFSIGRIRFLNVDLQLKIIVPLNRVVDCKETFEGIVKFSRCVEDRKDKGISVKINDFKKELDKNLFEFHDAYFFAIAAGLDGTGHQPSEDAFLNWRSFHPSSNILVDVSMNFGLHEAKKIPVVKTVDVLKYFKKTARIDGNVVIQLFPIFEFEYSGFSLKPTEVGSTTIFLKLTMYHPLAKAVDKKFSGLDTSCLRITNYLDGERQFDEYIRNRDKHEQSKLGNFVLIKIFLKIKIATFTVLNICFLFGAFNQFYFVLLFFLFWQFFVQFFFVLAIFFFFFNFFLFLQFFFVLAIFFANFLAALKTICDRELSIRFEFTSTLEHASECLSILNQIGDSVQGEAIDLHRYFDQVSGAMEALSTAQRKEINELKRGTPYDETLLKLIAFEELSSSIFSGDSFGLCLSSTAVSSFQTMRSQSFLNAHIIKGVALDSRAEYLPKILSFYGKYRSSASIFSVILEELGGLRKKLERGSEISPLGIGRFIIRLYEKLLFLQEKKKRTLKEGTFFEFRFSLISCDFSLDENNFSLTRIEHQVLPSSFQLPKRMGKITVSNVCTIICKEVQSSLAFFKNAFPVTNISRQVELALKEDNLKFFGLISNSTRRFRAVIPNSEYFRQVFGRFPPLIFFYFVEKFLSIFFVSFFLFSFFGFCHFFVLAIYFLYFFGQIFLVNFLQTKEMEFEATALVFGLLLTWCLQL